MSTARFRPLPSRGEDFHQDGKDSVRIETQLNHFWLHELEGLEGLALSEITRSLTEAGRFLSAGSCGYFGWLRNLGQHDIVLNGLLTQTKDLRLCQLRHLSHPKA